MSTAAQSAWNPAGTGALLWNGSSILEITSVSGPIQKKKTVEVTSMDSPNAFGETLECVVDGGVVEFEGNVRFVPGAQLTTMNNAIQNRTVHALVVRNLPPSGSKNWTANAICLSFEIEAKVDGKVAVKASFQLVSIPVYA